MHQKLIKEKYFALLFTLLLAMLSAPLTPFIARVIPLLHGTAAMSPQLIIITAATAWTAWRNVHFAFVPMLAGAVAVSILGALSIVARDDFAIIHIVAQIVFFAFVIVSLGKDLLTAKVVDGNTLAGSICLYVILGVIGGMVFSLVELIIPGSFYVLPALEPVDPNLAKVDTGVLMYFAFVTLTTVGYGDIVPASGAARSACVMLAVVGQLTIVVLISGLVGVYIAGKHRAK